MTACLIRNDSNRGTLVCIRTDVHTTHSFVSSSVPDSHTESEDAAERGRG